MKHSKPSPDIFIEAAKRISATPSSTLIFEDSLNGVIAGKKAGMVVVAVPHPEESDMKLFEEEADFVLSSLEGFFDIKDQLGL